MKLSLAIDQGNSSAKVAVFSGDKMLASARYEELTEACVANVLGKFGITSAIYSSVVGNDEAIVGLLKSQVRRFYVVESGLPLPISIGYATPSTLGNDRIAGAVGAMCLCPNSNLLVVDSGTAITYDVVTSDRCFRGGNIAPGISVRFEALARCCVRLPLVDSCGDVPLVGYDTPTAIRSGVVQGVVAEVAYMANRLAGELGAVPTVMLTGGDSGLIASHLNLGGDVVIENNLVTIGLNRILQYNELL